MEMEDVLYYTFIYDENFGFMADPNPKDPDHQFEYVERSGRQIPIKVYMRDHAKDFLDFLKQNRQTIEPILYTSGQQTYSEMILDIIDPHREIFRTRLFQPACHIFEKKDEDIFFLLKDISRFKNRDPKRTILLDSNNLNFLFSPDNSLPCHPFTAEILAPEGETDEYLLGLIEVIKDLQKSEDVRQHLINRYKIRQQLKNAKLI